MQLRDHVLDDPTMATLAWCRFAGFDEDQSYLLLVAKQAMDMKYQLHL